MTTNETITLVQKGPKSEDLDGIANLMETILKNMKTHVQNIHKNKKNDSSSVNSDFQNLVSVTEKGIMHDLKKNDIKSDDMSKNIKNSEENSKSHKNMNSARKPVAAVQNTQKKTLSNNTKKQVNSKNIQNSRQNSSSKQNKSAPKSQKQTPRKVQEVDRFVSRSLSTIKQGNEPMVYTVPNISNKTSKDKKRGRSPSITGHNTRTRSLSKTGNHTGNSPQQTSTNNTRSKSISSSISRNTSNTARLNKMDTRREKTVRGGYDPKPIVHKPSLYLTPKDLMEKHIHRNSNALRPMSAMRLGIRSNSNNYTRTVSLTTKTFQSRNSSPGTHNRNIKKTSINTKKSDQPISKPQNEVKKLQITKQTDNRSTFQKEKKVNDEKQNQIPKPSQIQPNKPNTLETNPVTKTIPINTKPIKFMKNKERSVQNLPAAKQATNPETKIDPKKEGTNEMGDCSAKLISEKLQDIIDKIKEEKDKTKAFDKTKNNSQQNENENKENVAPVKKSRSPNKLLKHPSQQNLNKENNTTNKKLQSLNKSSNSSQQNLHRDKKIMPVIKSSNHSQQNVNNFTNKKPLSAKSLGQSSIQGKPNSPTNYKRPRTEQSVLKDRSNTNNRINKKISSTSRHSVRSCNFPRTQNILCLPPARKHSFLTPMEIVQDFVNLVNRAKRDRKTYTVCGNYYSLRRAFAERGWVEKLRINLIDDRESWRKMEALSNFELVEGIKDKENGDKYRRVFLSKLLAGHQVDFYWDYMTNPFNVNNDKIKRTIINRFPYGATRSYTSKAGLCETLKDAHWYYVEGSSNILFPRTYNLAHDEEIHSFVEDFRLTAVFSLLRWINLNANDPTRIISANGLVPTSVFNFATMQCYNYIKIKEHRDLDEIVPMTKDYEWDIFLDKYYKIIHQGAHFKETENISAPLIIDQAKYILNKIRKFLPRVDTDGNMNLWLLKPNNGSRGCGIHVCRTLKYTLETVHSRRETKYVIQKYIERPLLIHKTKFDIRQWFLVTCMPNLQVWLYKDCYLRFSSQMYDLSKLHESIHLTNNSIQCRYKNNSNRSNALPEQNMWHSDQFRKYLTEIGQPYAWKNSIYKGIKECLVGLFMLCQDRFLTRVNSFELCGADFMITEDYHPYLIEINSRPALYPSTKITAIMCPKVLEDVVKVTIDYARNPRAATGNFELIYKDTYNYIPPKNITSIVIDGMSYLRYANDHTLRMPEIPFEKITIKEIDENAGSIQKILKIDPTKVRKDVKNTLEKILAIIHSEQCKTDTTNTQQSSDDKSKLFRMMLSEFVDIISSAKNKPEIQ